MISSTDVGSLPFPEDFDEEKFLKGSKSFERKIFNANTIDDESIKYFEEKVVRGFINKLKMAIIFLKQTPHFYSLFFHQHHFNQNIPL